MDSLGIKPKQERLNQSLIHGPKVRIFAAPVWGIVLLLLVSGRLCAQHTLRGAVVNGETGEPLPFATVFLANTTRGTTTDEKGAFVLASLPAGRYDLVVSYVGFEPFSFPVRTDSARTYRIGLKPEARQLATVTVRARRDPAWASRLQTFKRYFIGESRNARQCRLLNPDVLWFDSDSVYALRAGAREPLVLENRALGYRIRYQLIDFYTQGLNRYVGYQGFPVFEPLTPRNPREARRWEANRQEAYAGSMMHFLRAVHHRQVPQEGFVVRRLVRNESGAYLAAEPLGYPAYIDESHSDSLHTRLRFDDLLHITYPPEKEPMAYRLRQGALTGRAAPQTSLLRLTGAWVTVEASGTFYEPLDLLLEGYWGWEHTGDLLPLDYTPPD